MMFCSGAPKAPNAFMRFVTASSPNISWRSFSPRSPSSRVSIVHPPFSRFCLSSKPGRIALVDKCAYAEVKVLAAVTGPHQIVTIRQSRVQEASDRLLAHAHGDGCVMYEPRADFRDPLINVGGFDHADDKSASEGFFGGDHVSENEHALGIRWTERGNDACVVGHRQTIAQRARDGHAKTAARCGD